MASTPVLNPKITAAGLSLYPQPAQPGFSVTLTHIAIGTALYTPDLNAAGEATQVALKAEVARFPISSGTSPNPRQIQIGTTITDTDPTGRSPNGKSIGEIGFYAGNTLFAVWSRPDSALFVKSASLDVPFAYTLDVSILPTGSVVVTVTTDPQGMAALILQHEAKADPHPQYVTKARGIGEYDPLTIYMTGAHVAGPDGKTYRSLVDNNVGNTPASYPAKWERWAFSTGELSAEFIPVRTGQQVNGATTLGMVRITNPDTAYFSSDNANQTGAWKITLPTAAFAASLKMRVEIYDNSTGEAISLAVAGSVSLSMVWANPTVAIVGQRADRDFAVRFGNDGSKPCIWIGEVNSTWSSPRVHVPELMVSSNSDGGTIARWMTGWTITSVTAFNSVSATLTGNLVFAQSDIARVSGLQAALDLKAPLDSAPLTGQVSITGAATATQAQLSIKGASGALNNEGKLRFFGTFGTGSTDTGTRLVASIRAGFNGGGWGKEYLDFYLNSASNDAASDANQTLAMRISYGGRLIVGNGTVDDGSTALQIPNSMSISGAATSWRGIKWKSGTQTRWDFSVGSAAEAGNNANTGSILYLRRFNDDGTWNSDTMRFNRDTNLVEVVGPLTVGGVLNVNATANIAGNVTSNTGASANQLRLNANAGVFRYYDVASAGVARWHFGADNAAESGNSVGSNFFIDRFTDDNVSHRALTIDRPTGRWLLNGITDDGASSLQVPSSISISGAATTWRSLTFRTGTLARWDFSAGSGAESGSNAMSHLYLRRFNDDGTFNSDTVRFKRDSNLVEVVGALQVDGVTTHNSNVSLIGGTRLLVGGADDGATALQVTGSISATGGASVSSGSSTATMRINANAGQWRYLALATSGNDRWNLGADNAAESGGDAGSNFYMDRKTDSGSPNRVITIYRASGRIILGNSADDGANLLQLGGGLRTSGNISAKVGAATNIFNMDASAGNWRYMALTTAGASRWNVGADNANETGSSTGSNLYIDRITDDSVAHRALTIARASGRWLLNGIADDGIANLQVPLNVSVSGAATDWRGYRWNTGTQPRWDLSIGAGAETGSNAFGVLYLRAFDDTGAWKSDTMRFHRDNNLVEVPGPMTVGGVLTATTAPAAGDNSSKVPTTAWVTTTMLNAQIGQIAYEPRTSVRAGYLKLNGAVVNRADYPALWAYAQASGALVTDAVWSSNSQGCFSSGDGATTFRIPELRGEFLRCWDDGRGVDSSRAIGTWQDSQNRSHAHGATAAAVGDHVHTAYTDSQGAHSHGGGTGSVGDHQHGSPIGQNSSIAGTAPWGFWDTANNHPGLGNSDNDNSYELTSPAGAHNHSIPTDGSHGHNVGVNGAGNHTHTITVNADGGAETRTRNVAMLAMIRAY